MLSMQITHPECMQFSLYDLSSGVGGFLQMDLERFACDDDVEQLNESLG